MRIKFKDVEVPNEKVLQELLLKAYQNEINTNVMVKFMTYLMLQWQGGNPDAVDVFVRELQKEESESFLLKHTDLTIEWD